MAESLIKSLQLCLEVSPHFQLVLLGQGAGREQIRWLIKRYHLETQVWLLGDKPQNERSLEGFAVVVIGGRRPDWDDLSLALTAYEKKITVMGREGTILKDILESEEGRMVEMDDQQALSQAWLELYRNPPAVPSYQKRNKELVSFEALADKLLAII
jgi:glycosyltransferase involved in cell wall biosynthesis